MSDKSNSVSFGQVIFADSSVVSVDNKFANIFGYFSSDEIYSNDRNPLELISRDYVNKVFTQFQQLCAGLFHGEGDVIYTSNKEGDNLAVFIFAQQTIWNRNPAIQLRIFDISKTISPHQFLNRKQYQDLIARSEQGVIVHRNFKPLIMNQNWVDMMGGASIQDVMDNGHILDLIPKEHHEDALSRCQKILKGEKLGDSHIIENIRFDGEPRYFSMYDHSILWEGEPALEVVLVDVTDKVLAQKELAYKASHDSLTDLYNRDAIYQWIADHSDNGKPLGCMLIDMDNFKSINDTFGHQVGDKVLKRFSRMAKALIAEHGVMGRWGGEEFIVFIPDRDKQIVLKLAEQVKICCEEMNVFYEGDKVMATVSVGVSHTTVFTSINIKDLIRQADQNMYVSKTTGKNRVTG